MSLPPFADDGLLPAGDYQMTLEELRSSFLVTGSGVITGSWDASWRAQLVDNLAIVARQIWQVGEGPIYVDGSFVENKAHPSDIDGYFPCALMRVATGQLEADLNAIDPYRCWTWDPASRRFDPGTHKRQLPMWFRYRVELYPDIGQPFGPGLLDEFGNPLLFPSAFRRSNALQKPKGIVQLMP